jgi:hypothetical protein
MVLCTNEYWEESVQQPNGDESPENFNSSQFSCAKQIQNT